MTRVLHVLDSSADENTLQALALLIRRSAGDRWSTVCSLDAELASKASAFLGTPVTHCPRGVWSRLNWSPRLKTTAIGAGAELAHAWGVEAAVACAARLAGLPLVLTMLDPAATESAARWIRSVPRTGSVACASQVIRSRLIAGGMPPGQLTVIRGGVDFSEINRVRDEKERDRPVVEGGPIVLMHGPASRAGGQYYGLWACAIVAQIHRGLRVVLPFDSTESRRLERFVRQIRMPSLLVRPPATANWPRLLASADIFLAPAVGEICTEPLAWAMASGVPIVGSAVRSIAELVADKHNGLLCKPAQPRALASRLLTALEDHDLRRKVAETARGQAFEVFSVRAFGDHYEKMYANLLAGRAVGEAISDTAMVA